MSNSLLTSASRMLWRTIGSYAVDADQLFRDAGLDPTLLNDVSARYPVDGARQAWALAAERINDSCFGVNTGANWFPNDLHALGFAFLSSASLYTALYRVVRYNEIVDEVINFVAAEQGDQLQLSYENSRGDLPDIPALEVARWSIVLTMCRTAIGTDFKPLKVELVQAEMGCNDSYQAFFGCPVEYGKSRSCIYFDTAQLQETLPAPSAEIARLHDDLIREYLEKLHQDDDLTRQVAQLIRNLLPSGNISDEQVAQAVFMSPRTLQRKLASEGTTFKQILQDVRLAMANEYLRDDKLALIEVSFLLGFSEQSSFTRAYKRWTGVSPSDARAQT